MRTKFRVLLAEMLVFKAVSAGTSRRPLFKARISGSASRCEACISKRAEKYKTTLRGGVPAPHRGVSYCNSKNSDFNGCPGACAWLLRPRSRGRRVNRANAAIAREAAHMGTPTPTNVQRRRYVCCIIGAPKLMGAPFSCLRPRLDLHSLSLRPRPSCAPTFLHKIPNCGWLAVSAPATELAAALAAAIVCYKAASTNAAAFGGAWYKAEPKIVHREHQGAERAGAIVDSSRRCRAPRLAPRHRPPSCFCSAILA